MSSPSLFNASAHSALGAVAFLLLIIVISLTPWGDAQAKRGRAGVDLTGTTPLEASFFRDLRDQKMGRWSKSDAFFIASGVRQPQDLERARAWFKDKVRRAREALRPYRTTQERADHLLRWTHQTLFSTYRARSTDALEVIKYGRFNCLSSCLIYGLIAEELGLTVQGVAVEHHAFCRVYESAKRGARAWDVETTVALGFNPGRDVQISNAVVSVPRSRYRNRREVSLIEMIGLIYTNHMGLNAAFPSEADRLLAYQKALLFFPRDPTIQHNVVAAYTQLIQAHIKRAQWALAWQRLSELRGVSFGGHAKARAQKQKADHYADGLTFELASAHSQSARGRVGSPSAQEVLRGYAEASPRLKGLLTLLSFDEPLNTLRGLLAQETSPQTQGQLLERYAQTLKGIKGALNAAQAQGSSSAALHEQQRVTLHNLEASYTNIIIDAINSGRLPLAERLCAVARAHFPNDQGLKRLERTIKRAR